MSATITDSIVISTGEVSSGLTIVYPANVEVLTGGTLEESFVVSSGIVWVNAGGFIQNTSASEAGDVWVEGSAVNLTAETEGYFNITGAGAELNTGTIRDGGYGVIFQDAIAKSVHVSGGGSMYLYGGSAVDTVVSNGGELAAEQADGKLANTTVLEGGVMRLVSSGTAQDTAVNGGTFFVENGAATGTLISAGIMAVSAGNTVQNTTLNNGKLVISSGAVADTVAMNGGEMRVLSGTVQNATLNGGTLEVLSGSAQNTVVNTGAVLSALNTTVELATLAGGAFQATTASIAGLTMDDGDFQATATSVSELTVKGGTAVLDVNSLLSGKAVFTGEETVITVDGTIAFDTEFATSTEAQISGAFTVSDDTRYTLTVDSPTPGIYLLADNIQSFSGEIVYGDVSLALDTPVKIGDLIYTLKLVGENATVLQLTIAEPETDGVIYVNSEWAELPSETEVVINGVTATIGVNAFATGDEAAAVATAEDGKLRIAGGTVFFSTPITRDTVVYSGATLTNSDVAAAAPLVVNNGATLTGRAAFEEGASISVSGTVLFDAAVATAETAQFTNLSALTGNMMKCSLAVADDQAYGTYLLATGATGFNRTITVRDSQGQSLGMLLVGQTSSIGGSIYALGLDEEGVLALTISAYIPPTPTLAYVNSEWSGLEDGTVVKVDAKNATIGYDAFALLSNAIAAVTEDGAVEVVGGQISFAEGYSKTITVDSAATVVGKAVFASPITINGTVAFDTALATADAPQFGGFSFVSGSAKYTLNVAAPAAGTWQLASDAAAFNSTVMLGDVALTVGAEAAVVGDFTYALSLTEGVLVLTVEVYVPPTPTLAYVDSEWISLDAGTIVKVGSGTAKIGYDAFAVLDDAIAAVTEDGAVEVFGGEITFAGGYSKTITVDAAATVVGRNTFTAPVTINGTVLFDTSVATADVAQFAGFSFVSGSAKYTLSVAAPAAGTWMLASDAAAFNSPVMLGANKLTVGAAPTLIGDFTYALSLTEGVLTLTVDEFVPPVPTVDYVYVNSAWSDKKAGDIVTVGGTTATIGVDAFATGDIAIVSVTDDGAVEVVGGEVNFNKAIAKSVTVDVEATLIGKAAFTAPITIDGTVAFDTAFAAADTAQFSGFSFVTGDASYTLTVAAPAVGTWLLATDAAAFNSIVMFGEFTMTVGADPVAVGDFTYAISLTEGTLALTIGEYVPPPVPALAYVNSEWADIPEGETVPVGDDKTARIGYDAFATLAPAIAAVTEEGAVEVVGGVITFGDYSKTITVDAGATVIGKNTFDKPLTINGTILFDPLFATADAAQFGGFSFAAGSATYALNIESPAAGTWMLASEVTGFTGSVMFGDVALTVGDAPVAVGDFSYALSLAEGTLVLTIAEYVPPAELAYVNSAWSGLEPGVVVPVGDTTATIGYDAFAALAPAVAAVAEDGSIEVVGGEVTVEAYGKTITVDAGAAVVGKNTFAAPITVNGTISFDTAFATSAEAQFSGFSFLTGTATYTLTDAAPAAGIFLLASDAAGFNSKIAFGDIILRIGDDPVQVGDFTYALALTEGTLALTVAEYVPPVELYVNSDWAGLAEGTVVTIGGTTATIGIDAFATGDEANAVATDGNRIDLVNGEAFFSEAAHGVCVLNGATLLIDNEAGIDHVEVANGGFVSMTKGVMSKCTIEEGGALTAESGALIDGLTYSGYYDESGTVNVQINGATVRNAVMSGSLVGDDRFHCIMNVAGEGGLVQTAEVTSGGYLTVSSGGRAEDIILAGDTSNYLEGELFVSEGGTASAITVSSGGYLGCARDAVVNDFVILDGGQAYLRGSAGKAFVNGVLGMEAGGVITGATIATGGTMWTVNSVGLGSAFDTGIQSGGSVYNAGYASNTVILTGGTMTTSQDSLAEKTEVQSGGSFLVSSYSGFEHPVARDVEIKNGGIMHVTSAATLTGKITFEEGADVTMDAGSILEFDISGLTGTEETPLVNDFSFVGAETDLTLTVSGENQAAGLYLLADGATEFDRGIAFGEYTLTVGGEPVKVGENTFELSLSGDMLILSVIAPMPLTYVNSEWTGLPDGTVVPIDEEAGVTAVIGVDAFATGDAAVAKTAKTGMVQVVGGTVSFVDPVDKDLVICQDAMLVGKAVFTDDVTVTNNGTVAFDTAYATATEAQFSGFDADEEGSGAFTLTIQSGHAAVKNTYLLATGAGSLNGSAVAYGDFAYTVGGIDFFVDEKKLSYVLDLTEENDLVLSFVKLLNGPDDHKNDWLYDKSIGGLNPRVDTFTNTILVDGVTDIAVDRKGSVKDRVARTTYYNFISMRDTADFAKITLKSAASLSFNLEASDAAKFTVWSLETGEDKKGNVTYKVKSLQSTSLKMDKATGLYTAMTKNLLLDLSKDYFISMQSTNKKSVVTYYNVTLNQDPEAKYSTVFYTDGDDGTNNWLYNKKNEETPLNPDVYGSDPFVINAETTDVRVDKADTVCHEDEYGVVWNNFAGFGDDTDFVKISLDDPSQLSFNVTATGAAKFIVYSLETGVNKKGETTYKMKALQTTSLKKTKVEVSVLETRELYMATTKDLLLDLPADNQSYYIAVQSTSAKKGDQAYYNVTINADPEEKNHSVFYSDADDGTNNWLYDKKNEETPVNPAVWNADPIEIVGVKDVCLDVEGSVSYTDEQRGVTYCNYVGFGDAADYARISFADGASMTFHVEATGASKFTFYSLTIGEDKKGNTTYTLKSLQTLSLKKVKDGDLVYYVGDTREITPVAEGNVEFFLAMESTNAKKGDAVYYNVTAAGPQPVQSAQDSSALSMPDAASAAFADAAAFDVLNNEQSWQSLVSLA